MTTGLGEMLPGFLLDILKFGGQLNVPLAIAVPLSDNSTPVYSNSFPLRRGLTYSFEIKLGGTGTKAVKVQLEQSNQRPGTEGSADNAWVVPDDRTTIFADITDTNTHIAAYAPEATAFGRLKVIGLTGNDASTVISVARAYGIKTI